MAKFFMFPYLGLHALHVVKDYTKVIRVFQLRLQTYLKSVPIHGTGSTQPREYS
jgi:hypothetical protein